MIRSMYVLLLSLLLPCLTVAQSLRINGNRTLEGTLNHCVGTSGSDAYACNLDPAITGYTTGVRYTFEADVANTGAASLNLNGRGVKTLKKWRGAAKIDLVTGDIQAGEMVDVIDDGTDLQVLSPPGLAAALRICMISIGAENGTFLVNADLGPQLQQCQIPYAATIKEITIAADGGTPSVQLQKRHCATFTAGTCATFTLTNLLSAALAAPATALANACAMSTTSQTCLDGTTSSGTVNVSTTAIGAGDYIEIASGTAGGTAKRVSIAVTMAVN
jgi:hypothetical protein